MQKVHCSAFLLIFLQFSVHENFIEAASTPPIKNALVQAWAAKFGNELGHLGDFITRRKEVLESFKQAQVVSRFGAKIVDDMSKEIKYMMDAKISAVRRIVDSAQEVAAISDEEVENNFTYFNSKSMIEPSEIPSATLYPPAEKGDYNYVKSEPKPPIIYLTESDKFGEYVNLSLSSVHVPSNVYDRANEVIKAIKWSENLDSIFVNNYNRDPSLAWQFFCSSAGFLRQFPATKWKFDPVDLYDCRLRQWYIQAANSPRDMIILIDNSGSMTGMRKDIAKHVVESLLDTLTANDFVNIFTFSEEIAQIVECFSDTLVQANMANIRELKLGLKKIETAEIANFSAALTKAFEILQLYRLDRAGASCNQAIMLVSDGVPYAYTDIFEMYNWQEKPTMPVRIFTYLIGKEVADVKEIKDMACNNQGYYVHLSTLADVKEQVQNYIPVMARPLVLNRTDHPVMWSQVYADVVDPLMTDYEWECRERIKQKQRFEVYRKNNKNVWNLPEDPSQLSYDSIEDDNNDISRKYIFMTSVSIPVYDKRENATRVAHLLGVAGTDIPLADIKKLMQPFLLGVGGYAFIVDNNGYILMHPDFRPIFYKDILKPAYNMVDMAEVELMDDENEIREFNPLLLSIREAIINQSTGSKWMYAKFHYDRMRRSSRVKRHYYWTEIKDTPFTLVVTYPETFGQYRLQTRTDDEIHRVTAKGTNVLNFFSGHNWKIHPDWLYCKHSNDSFSTPEAELTYFLQRMTQPGWRWPLNRSPPPPEHATYTNISSGKFQDKDSYYCDRNLMQSLVYDAKITEWFSKNSTTGTSDKGNEFKQRFGVSVAFLATHSGLLRWQDYNAQNDDIRPENEFSEYNRKAIDEIWYKRAIEQHYLDPMSFVYSVPFDAGNRNDTLVTASHAVFHKENGKSAPVAIVGFQFQHSAMYTLFKNITSTCNDASCSNSCASDDIDCFVLDDHGYIIVGPDTADTGKFFGEVKAVIMKHLVDERIFKQVKIFDYQAVCFINKDGSNPANILITPFRILWRILQAVKNYLLYLVLHFLIDHSGVYGTYSYGDNMQYDNYDLPDPTERYDMPASKSKEQDFDKRVLINRTRPEKCDKIITLYQLTTAKEEKVYERQMTGCERPFVVTPIPSSNMILVVVDILCPNDNPSIFKSQPVEKDYNATSLQCHKARSPPLYRRTLRDCFNKHHNESGIEICGRAPRSITFTVNLLGLTVFLLFKYVLH